MMLNGGKSVRLGFFPLQHLEIRSLCNVLHNIGLQGECRNSSYKSTLTQFFFPPVYMRCTGGEVGATSSLAPKIGPLGLVSIIILVYIV